jgi:hypothetical protein
MLTSEKDYSVTDVAEKIEGNQQNWRTDLERLAVR